MSELGKEVLLTSSGCKSEMLLSILNTADCPLQQPPPQQKEYAAPNVSNAQDEKPCVKAKASPQTAALAIQPSLKMPNQLFTLMLNRK